MLKKMMTALFLMFISIVQGQENSINSSLLTGSWTANWITHPEAAQRGYGVYHFRKNFELSQLPASFIVQVSADNRYRLFVNGAAVCSGPARGDLFNWYFETVDLAPYLKVGKNTIAALVWNMGELAPVAQISNQIGFLLQGNTAKEAIVNTNSSWLVLQNKAYSPTSLDNRERLQAYMVVGPGDQVDGKQYPWGWEKNGYDDQAWLAAKPISDSVPIGYGTDNLWTMAPRTIPLFKEGITRFPSVRRTSGISVPDGFLAGNMPFQIPAHQSLKVLFDHQVACVAYPELLLSAGKGAKIKLTYAEALFDQDRQKGNRNEIEGKEILGNYDVFIADGGQKRLFRPLWWKAYRYVEMEISTRDEPLLVHDFYGQSTGYPLVLKASFESSDPSLKKIWETGWRTAELCAGELYYDTPYYEQLQYTGDSRIQALISLYLSGDDRLMRKAITDFYHSRTPEGLTQGRYPSNRLQIIPTFSLFWVSMVHDYWMHRKDDAFVKQFLPAIAEIMTWYENRIQKDKGMLGPMKWWNFVDWDNFNDWGVAPGAEQGNSSIISLQCAYTMKQAATLFHAFGKKEDAEALFAAANELNTGTYQRCFNAEKGLIADTPEKLSYSQHAGIWAVLSGAVRQEAARNLMSKLLNTSGIGQVTFFYRFYLVQAMKRAGMANQYVEQLGPWRNMLEMGLTTFAEKPEPTRSDCHAWSASPNYDFLATICGIMPSAPGFRKVNIAPAFGPLSWIKASMPHPNGMIYLELQKTQQGKGIKGKIELPEKLSGTFYWEGKEIELHEGKQVIQF